MANATLSHKVTTKEVIVQQEIKTPVINLELNAEEAVLIRLLIGRVCGVPRVAENLYQALKNVGVPDTSSVMYDKLPHIDLVGLLDDDGFKIKVAQLERK